MTCGGLHVPKLWQAYTRISGYGGFLPSDNEIGFGLAEFQSPLHLLPYSSWSTGHQGCETGAARSPKNGVPTSRYAQHNDSCLCGPAYLSLPLECSWWRMVPWGNFHTQKDWLFWLPSALNRNPTVCPSHQCDKTSPQDTYPGPKHPCTCPATVEVVWMVDSKVPAMEENLVETNICWSHRMLGIHLHGPPDHSHVNFLDL